MNLHTPVIMKIVYSEIEEIVIPQGCNQPIQMGSSAGQMTHFQKTNGLEIIERGEG